MSSQSNDNGRYFEYLISKYLSEEFGVILTPRASEGQLRDQVKSEKIKEVNKLKMVKSLETIADWIQTKISLNIKTELDRLPDKDSKNTESGHSDIDLRSPEKKIALSIKYNHQAVFHGRPYTLPEQCGFDESSDEAKKFMKEQYQRSDELRSRIAPGTEFALPERKGVKEEYQKDWGDCMRDLVMNSSNFLNSHGQNKNLVKFIFNTIIGSVKTMSGEETYRLILKGKKLTIQDISSLSYPKSLKAEAKQRGVIYQWFLFITFDSGLVIKSRYKHDERVITNFNTQLKIKPDWQVEDWGKSGMKEESVEIKT